MVLRVWIVCTMGVVVWLHKIEEFGSNVWRWLGFFELCISSLLD